MSRTPESRRSFLVSILSRTAGTYVVATAGLSGIASFVMACGTKYGGAPRKVTYDGPLPEQEPKPASPSAIPSTTTTAAAQTTSSSPPPVVPAEKYGGPARMPPKPKYGGPTVTPRKYGGPSQNF